LGHVFIGIILIVILVTLFSSIPTSFADHITASVSIPAGTSVPGCEQTNECWDPAEVTVDVGGVVTWSNDDAAAHTVTSGSAANGPSGVFDSSLLIAGGIFEHTFDSIGTEDYFCLVHPWMTGVVIVTETGQSNENLIVSVEEFGSDRFSGPMVIEVIINDPDLKDTDETETEPDVKVNGKILRMVQTVDGNWRGYFANRAQAQLADSTVGLAGFGLDFGRFCPNTDGAVLGIDVTKTVGFALFRGTGGAQGNEAIGPTCSFQSGDPNTGNVVRDAQQATPAQGGILAGQIGLVDVDVFPSLQLFLEELHHSSLWLYQLFSGTLYILFL